MPFRMSVDTGSSLVIGERKSDLKISFLAIHEFKKEITHSQACLKNCWTACLQFVVSNEVAHVIFVIL